MLPVPTLTCRVLFFSAVVLAALGIATSRVTPVIFGNLLLVTLAVCLLATAPLGRRARRERLEFAWWRSTSATVHPRATLTISCFVRNHGASSVVLTGLNAHTTNASLAEPLGRLVLPPSSRVDFQIRFTPLSVGRAVLQGMAARLQGPLGLFEMPLYFPTTLTLRVLPEAVDLRPRRHHPRKPASGANAGRTSIRRRGGGTAFYELRELLPGDPYRSIAWKASARSGRLLVKEVEREIQHTHWLIIDVCGTMRPGPLGHRKLDRAIELAAARIRAVLSSGDRLGLFTVDTRILRRIRPRDGKRQYLRAIAALLETMNLVDEDLTQTTETELTSLVANHIRQNEGVELLVDDATRPANLVPQVAARLRLPEGDPTREPSDVLRAFCLKRGIELPHREDRGTTAEGLALANALRVAGSQRAGRSTITVITDLRDLNLNELGNATKVALAHGHEVDFVVVLTPTHATKAPTQETFFERLETERVRLAARALAPLGARIEIDRAPHSLGAPA